MANSSTSMLYLALKGRTQGARAPFIFHPVEGRRRPAHERPPGRPTGIAGAAAGAIAPRTRPRPSGCGRSGRRSGSAAAIASSCHPARRRAMAFPAPGAPGRSPRPECLPCAAHLLQSGAAAGGPRPRVDHPRVLRDEIKSLSAAAPAPAFAGRLRRRRLLARRTPPGPALRFCRKGHLLHRHLDVGGGCALAGAGIPGSTSTAISLSSLRPARIAPVPRSPGGRADQSEGIGLGYRLQSEAPHHSPAGTATKFGIYREQFRGSAPRLPPDPASRCAGFISTQAAAT